MPMKPAGARKHRADQKANGDQDAEEISKQREDHDSDDADRRILAAQIGLRAFTYCRPRFPCMRAFARIGGEYR